MLGLDRGHLALQAGIGLHSRACRGKLKSGFAGRDSLPFLSVFQGEHPLSNLGSSTCLLALANPLCYTEAAWLPDVALSCGLVLVLTSIYSAN